MPSSNDSTARGETDLITLGRRIRHLRTAQGLTLDALGEKVGSAPSLLSLVENGRREPRLGLLRSIAEAFGVPMSELLSAEPPSRRAALEIALDRAQRGPLFTTLGVPAVKPSQKLPMPVLEQLVGLHEELARREQLAIATPEEARRANTELRLEREARDNHYPQFEAVAEQLVKAAGYTGGALTHRTVARMAEQMGFTLLHVDDLPRSARSVTDLQNGRIYLPPASTPGGHGLRSLALQALAHRVLEHDRPRSYGEFLRQRVEITYFAAACLAPQFVAVPFLEARKRDRDLAVEDFRDAFGITHEAAAMRLTNLATHHLGIPLHFLRVGADGALFRGYANDGLPFPQDVTGAIEGQLICRRWAAREAFERPRSSTSTPTHRPAPSGAPPRPGRCRRRAGRTAGPVRSRSRWACPTPTPSGSAGGTPRCGGSPRARTRRAASVRPRSSPNAGPARPGRPVACTSRSSPRSRAARSPGWTTQRCTRSSTSTRRSSVGVSPGCRRDRSFCRVVPALPG